MLYFNVLVYLFLKVPSFEIVLPSAMNVSKCIGNLFCSFFDGAENTCTCQLSEFSGFLIEIMHINQPENFVLN